MPGSTPKLALPYPLGTDLIADGDDTIKSLAERVEAVMSPTVTTAWNQVAVGNGYTGNVWWLKRSGLVTCFLIVNKASFAGAETIGTLPPEARPLQGPSGPPFYVMVGQATGAIRIWQVLLTGEVQSGAAGTGSIYGLATWPAATV